MTKKPNSASERILKLALYLQKRSPVTFEEIREALPPYKTARNEKALHRMFERDKRMLADCGFSVKVDDRNRYILDPGANYAAPVELSAAQAGIVRLVCTALLADSSYPFAKDLRMMLAKIEDDFGGPDEFILTDTMRSLCAPARDTDPYLEDIRDAIERRKRIAIDYRDSQGKESSRDVLPFGCFIIDGKAYLAAHDLTTDEDRTFRTDRITNLQVNTTTPSKSDFEAIRFDPREWYGLSFQFGEENFQARVRFDARAAWRSEQLCMQRGTFTEAEDSRIWEIEANSTDALIGWCIENGPGVVPVSPPELHAAYREAVTRAKEACYGRQ